LRKKIVDPMDEILSAPALALVAAPSGNADADVGRMNCNNSAAGGAGRHKMADHVDSGEQVGWDSDEVDYKQPHAALPSMSVFNAPSPLKRSNAAGNAGAGAASKRAKKRIRWDAQETDDLLAGIQKHGTGWGCWQKILDDPEYTFAQRSNQDLKDKYRNLSKNT
jgi:hypothetical protein